MNDKINDTNKNVICAAPWAHLYIDMTGLFRPCCTSSEIYGDTRTTTVREAWASEAAQEFRKDLLAGVEKPGCKFCYQQEKHTGDSLRTSLNSMYGHLITDNLSPELAVKSLHPGWSNLCNMACIMCNSMYSSLWHKDEEAMGKDMSGKDKFLDITREVETDIVDNLINGNLERVYFAGGEPLMAQSHYRIIEKLIESDVANNIELRYSSNLSLLKYKSVDLVERWSHFKSVEISASIDMMGPHAEFHRYGINWETIDANLRTIQDVPHVKLAPTITVTALSIGYLPELLTYFFDELKFDDENWIHFNLAMWPSHLNPHLLPTSVKEFYTNKLQDFLVNAENTYPEDKYRKAKSVIKPVLEHMNETDKSEDFNTMIDFLDTIAKIRKQDWKLLWPEIANEIPTLQTIELINE